MDAPIKSSSDGKESPFRRSARLLIKAIQHKMYESLNIWCDMKSFQKFNTWSSILVHYFFNFRPIGCESFNQKIRIDWITQIFGRVFAGFRVNILVTLTEPKRNDQNIIDDKNLFIICQLTVEVVVTWILQLECSHPNAWPIHGQS